MCINKSKKKRRAKKYTVEIKNDSNNNNKKKKIHAKKKSNKDKEKLRYNNEIWQSIVYFFLNISSSCSNIFFFNISIPINGNVDGY